MKSPSVLVPSMGQNVVGKIFLLAASLASFASSHDVMLQPGWGVSNMDDYPHQKYVLSIYSIEVNVTELREADAIILPSQDYDRLVRTAVYGDDAEPYYQTVIFQGEDNDGTASLAFDSRRKNTVVGTMYDDDAFSYVLQDGEGGEGQVLIVRDYAKLSRTIGDDTAPETFLRGSSDEEMQNIPQEKIEEALQKGKDDQDTVAKISLKIYITEEYEEAVGKDNVKLKILSMLGDANTGFKNSKIAIQLYLHCIEKYPGPEGKPIFEEFASFKDNVPGSADLAILVVDDTHNGWCGMANYKNLSHPTAVVGRYCLESAHGAGHQIGHILGAQTNIEQIRLEEEKLLKKLEEEKDTKGLKDFRRFNGTNTAFLMLGTNKATIMGHDTDGWHPKIVNYYSRAGEFDRGRTRAPVGTEEADNAKTLNERRFAYEVLGDESQDCGGSIAEPAVAGLEQSLNGANEIQQSQNGTENKTSQNQNGTENETQSQNGTDNETHS